MNIREKLLAIQDELKAPKGQYNSFGKYKYRNCEDILEAVKPLCKKHKAVLKVGDELVVVGERYYIKSTAIICDLEKEENISNTAYAREELEKKGMDGSQITGTASSYARKYALNGLFCIDDTKDADTDEYKEQEKKNDVNQVSSDKITETNLKVLQAMIKTLGDEAKQFYSSILQAYKVRDLSSLTNKQYGLILLEIKKIKGE